MIKLEDFQTLDQYTEEGQKIIADNIEIVNKMLSNVTPDELKTLVDFANEFQFGLFDLLNIELQKRKPELYK